MYISYLLDGNWKVKHNCICCNCKRVYLAIGHTLLFYSGFHIVTATHN